MRVVPQLSLRNDLTTERTALRHRGEAPGMSMTSSHWGVFTPMVTDGRIVDVRSFALDSDPSLIIRSLPDAVHPHCRVMQPAVREG